MKHAVSTTSLVLFLLGGTLALGQSSGSLPDYRPHAVTFTPAAPHSLEPFTVSVVTQNGVWPSQSGPAGAVPESMTSQVAFRFDDEYRLHWTGATWLWRPHTNYDTMPGLGSLRFYTNTFEYTPKSAGTKAWEFIVDARNDIQEQLEDNNRLTGELTIGQSPPDLLVDHLSWSPAAPTQQDALTVTVRIRNRGDNGATPVLITLELIPEKHNRTILEHSVPAIEGQSDYTWVLTAPSEQIQTGTLDLICRIDPHGWIEDEYTTDNNTDSRTIQVAQGPADLVLEEFTLNPERRYVGETVEATVKIRNRGYLSSPATRLRLSADPWLDDSTDIPPLGVDDTYTHTVVIECLTAGAFELIAQTDPDNLVHEDDKANNRATRSLVVEPTPKADLIVKSISAVPNAPTSVDAITVKVDVANVGQWPSTECKLQVGIGDVIQVHTVQALAPGEQATVELPPFTPSAPQTLVVTATIDSENQVPDIDTSNNSRSILLTVDQFRPAMNIQRMSSGVIRLTWENPGQSWKLQTGTFSGGSSWNDITGSENTSNIEVSTTKKMEFYRLRHTP